MVLFLNLSRELPILITLDLSAQIKVITLEIVKIYVSESEHRVAHLMLYNLCNEYPDDSCLWSALAKLYLDIGKKQAAADTFEKAHECMEKLGKVSKEVIEATKLIDA